MNEKPPITPEDSHYSGYSESWPIKRIVGDIIVVLGIAFTLYMLVMPNQPEIALSSAQAAWLRSNGRYVSGAGVVVLVLMSSYVVVLIQEWLRERKGNAL